MIGVAKLSFISTPNLSIKRKLKEHNKYKIEYDNLKIHINGKLRKLQSIVTFKMSNGRICV